MSTTDPSSPVNPYAAPQSETEGVTAKTLLADELVSILDQTRVGIRSVARVFTLIAIATFVTALLFISGDPAALPAATLLIVCAAAMMLLSVLLYQFAGKLNAFVQTREVSQLLTAFVYQRRFWRYLAALASAFAILLMIIVVFATVS